MSRIIFALSIVVLFCSSASVSAQKKRSIEIYRGTEGTRDGKPITPREESIDAPKASARKNAVRVGENISPQAKAAMAAEIRNASRLLADRSFDAFQRGLMPLQDHLDQLTTAADANFQLATTREGQLAIAAAHRNHLLRVVNSIERAKNNVGLPGVPGFGADLVLSKAMLAQSDLEIATIRKDEDGIAAASELAVNLARQHLEFRKIDAELGVVDAKTLTSALLLTPEGYENAQTILSNLVMKRRQWAEKNSEGGIGRADRLAESEMELARFQYFLALDAKDNEAADQYMRLAEQASNRMYQARLRYYGNGTASLYEVARAWNARREFHLMKGDKTLADKEALASDQREFQRVADLAANTRDQRGRNAADVAYVSLLRTVNRYPAR